MAGSLKTAVFAENKEALENIIGGVISEEEVISVSIFSTEWDVIYETNKKATKSDRTDSYRDAAAELNSSNATKIIEKPDVIECLTSLSLDVSPDAVESLYFEKSDDYPQKKIIGYVRVGLDKTLMTSEIKSSIFEGPCVGPFVYFLRGGYRLCRSKEGLDAAYQAY